MVLCIVLSGLAGLVSFGLGWLACCMYHEDDWGEDTPPAYKLPAYKASGIGETLRD